MKNLRPQLHFIFLSFTLLAVDITFSTFYVLISGNTSSIVQTILMSIAFLGIINVSGGLWLFRDIGKREMGDALAQETLSRNIQMLPVKNAVWVFCLTLAYVLTSLSMGNFLLDDATAEERLMPVIYFSVVWFSLLYAFQFSLYAYFIGIASSIHTRNWFHREYKLEIPSVKHRLVIRLLMGMFAIILIPSSLILTDVWYFEEIRKLQGLTTKQAILLDILSMLVAAIVSVVFICRSITLPLQNIRDAMEKTSSGNETVAAVVLTDDEIGVVASSFNKMMDKINERKFIVETFGRYVPETVAATIIKSKGEYKPQYRQATILYTDIVGFTSLCEKLQPDDIASLLNEYFSLLTAIINKHGGIINQFQGDAMLITYNVPARDKNHADDALRTAIEIQKLLSTQLFKSTYKMPTRIGINTGKVFAGTIGGKDRLNYTVHGDAVNIAARLENLNKEYDTSILISKATKLLISNSLKEQLQLIPMGKLQVRGKVNNIRVYSVPIDTV
ncbi:adenylate/guanylate cyclase domain-containing protein [Aestuariirhabdus sp. Z084]|uniref:adenylate/guanylate cyclase domain-containing protein n=1 Tax=Aestuariirhabdus haliotis TaxID=2918751 RepID=UPI00201B4337|nr:adenylate/guanylate cyclase domain-containing protein [Aestuariirhabdus haliotis]MCL6414033.1 adenylate/guanylate cyclase domain-containing protein [Aestuariirhabdus haliotis]MCL6417966.1 adenylate/guanylate cyclase domain-containing protein [Aestuariirhabdus haliotis]